MLQIMAGGVYIRNENAVSAGRLLSIVYNPDYAKGKEKP